MGFPGILEKKTQKKTVSHDQICKDQNPSLKGHQIGLPVRLNGGNYYKVI